MQIQNNLSALAASRQLAIQSSNFQKTTEKLASGYRINRAADDAAQLSISEKMRTQIRGLNQSVQNAEDGANYIQVADGAMEEIHSLIHRMNELTVGSLNDTNTSLDRAAMAAEFDQLQSEIDRISKNTYYNTMEVFEPYAPSHYQILGNRHWSANHPHSIAAPNNDFVINLPSSYAPDPTQYTLTVPDGIYTTQELVDEIEDAFTNSLVPSPNPGFTLEFTEDGFCNLNFESETGEPTEVASVGGALSYLIYDNYTYNTSAGLLGTTEFEVSHPLEIVRGKNDTLSFRLETKNGLSQQIQIVIPPNSYTRDEMIDLLNDKLKAIPGAAGVTAVPHGSKCIQITGGATASITSLKGNMFNIEDGKDTYNSVFYDNICPGLATSQTPYVDGGAYFNDEYTEDIVINSTNDTLALTFEDGTAPITITIPRGTYALKEDPANPGGKTLDSLVKSLNTSLDAATNGKVSANLGFVSKYINGAYRTFSYIRLESTAAGKQYKFDLNPNPSNTVWNDTYETLFTTTNYNYIKTPTKYSGSPVNNASFNGAAKLKVPLTLDSNQLTINVNGADYPIMLPNGSYSTLSSLAADIKNSLVTSGAFPPSLKDKIDVTVDGYNRITLAGTDETVKNITVKPGGAYKQLFVGYGETANYFTASKTGEEYYQQGSTAPLPGHNEMISVTMGFPIPDGNIVIDGTNDTLQFGLNSSYDTVNSSVTLRHGTYTRQQLVEELNTQLSGYTLKASMSSDNKLVLTTTPTGKNTDLRIYVNTRYGSAWKAFVGTATNDIDPIEYRYSEGGHTYYQGQQAINNIVLDSKNSTFNIVKGGVTHPVILKAGVPYTAEQLCQAINSQLPPNTVTATTDPNSKRIRIESTTGGTNSFTIQPTSTDSFYSTVLGQRIVDTEEENPYYRPGSHTYTEPFIVGREDLRHNEVEIIKGLNDIFTLDLNYPGSTTPLELTCTIPPGIYSYDEVNDRHGIAEYIQKEFQKQLDANPAMAGLEIEAKIGHSQTGVTGAIDNDALAISLKEKGKEVPPGTYILDGVRGTAAYFTFYKTTGKLVPSYVIGMKDITDGVDIGPENNEFSFTVDGTKYSYTFPDGHYTAQDVLDFLNNEFQNGPNPIKMEASLSDGRLKLSYTEFGAYDISDISGSAKGTIFYAENSREPLDAFMLQVGALGHQGLELPRLRVSTTALGINSITITRPKYANKALNRLSRALDLISANRSTYGALHNRIEHLTANNRNTSENVQASESRMRDADMASEMVDHAKYQILTQASESVLAQANQLPNMILSLLGSI